MEEEKVKIILNNSGRRFELNSSGTGWSPDVAPLDQTHKALLLENSGKFKALSIYQLRVI